MLAIVLVTLVLVVAAAPMALASAALVARCWPGARASEIWLGAGLLTPAALVIEVACVGSIPAGLAARPVDALAWVHGAAALACAWAAWRARASIGDLLGRSAVALREARDAAPLALRLLAAGALVWHAGAVLLGMWHWSAEMDDLRYHLPQAVQVYADGRLGTVHAGVVWADSFPRGVALLWAWTLALTGHDAGMHLVNGAAGVLLALAAAVGARRLGADRVGAGFAAAAVLPTPAVSYLTGISYTDLPIAACIASAAALAMPREDAEARREEPAARLALVGLGLALALWAKFQPSPAAVAVGLAAVGLAWTGRPRRIGGVLAILAASALLASVPYVFTWREYGSPVYPLQLRLGGWVLFPGPMDPDAIGASAQVAWAARFSRYWLDFLAPMGPETPGSLGPAFGLVLMPMALGAAMIQPARLAGRAAGPRGLVVVAALVAVVLLVPLMHWPRYSLWMVGVSAAVAGLVFSGCPPAARGALAAVTLALSVGGAGMFARHVGGAGGVIERTLADLPEGAAWWASHASRRAADGRDFSPAWASPTVREVVRRAARPGATVVQATPTPSVLLTDARYTYRVHHRPARAWPAWWVDGFDPLTGGEGGGAWGRAEGPAWAEGLAREGVTVVVVIRGSAEDEALQARGEGSVWALRHEDPPSRGKWALRVYGRAGG